MIRPALALLIAAAALTGCQHDTSPPAGFGDAYPAPLNDPQIAVLDESLREWLAFHPAIITPSSNGVPMQVEVPVRNLAQRDYMIDYRIIFFDENDRTLDPVMGWTPAPLREKETIRLRAGALDTRAEAYRIEVKWAR